MELESWSLSHTSCVCREASFVKRETGWFLLFIWFVLFIWLNETNQMNQMDQTNQINQSGPFSGAHARVLHPDAAVPTR